MYQKSVDSCVILANRILPQRQFIQRAGNSTPQIKYAKKYRKLFIGVDTDALWWSFLAIILIHIHQT